jgi:hypothetical protein
MVSDGQQWGRGTCSRQGRWQTDDDIEPLYWQRVALPPRSAYLSANGDTIISLYGGLVDDLHATVMPGDELWSASISELSNGESAYLTFVDVLPQVAVFTRKKYPQGMIADWQWIRQLVYKLGGDSCYIRRVYQ